jgi:hypothetical protein
MRRSLRAMGALTGGSVAALLIATGCGTLPPSSHGPTSGDDGRVPATPRALAAVVTDHVGASAGEARRSTGRWSDYDDPLTLEAQVDYGVDPEGAEDGETRTVRITVADLNSYGPDDRKWFTCQPQEKGRCESTEVDDGTLLYRWYPGEEEEEPGSAGWTVIRADEVVHVAFEGSGYYRHDPRTIDLGLDLDDLRAAALDPAMSLRTTPQAWQRGADLTNYVGVEHAPTEPTVAPTTPHQLAARVVDYLEIEPVSVRRSTLTDLGPDAVGAHLRFAGTNRYAPFTIDILTAVGRARQISPLPCPVQRSADAAATRCFSWDDDTVATWTLAREGRPGVLWIIGAHDDEEFNRVESVALKVVSTGIVAPFFTDPAADANRIPRDLLASLGPFPSDLSIGPQTRTNG